METKDIKNCIRILEQPKNNEYKEYLIISMVAAFVGILLSSYIAYISNPEYKIIDTAGSWRIDVIANQIPFGICLLISSFIFLIPILFCWFKKDINILPVCVLVYISSLLPLGLVLWFLAFIGAVCSLLNLNIFSLKKMSVCFLLCLGAFFMICNFNKVQSQTIIQKLNNNIDTSIRDAINGLPNCADMNLPSGEALTECLRNRRISALDVEYTKSLLKIPEATVRQRILAGVSEYLTNLMLVPEEVKNIRLRNTTRKQALAVADTSSNVIRNIRELTAQEQLREGIAPDDFIKNISSSAPNAILYFLYQRDF